MMYSIYSIRDDVFEIIYIKTMHIMYYDSGFPLIDCMHAYCNLNTKLFYISSVLVK